MIEAVPPLAPAHPSGAIWPGIDSPENSARRVQLVHCQRYRNPRRQVFVAGMKRFSRLCVLMNPYPAGRSIHPDLAGYILEKTSSPADRTVPGGTQEVNLQVRQLTNRRMRTFIAAPSARNVNNTEDPP